MNNSSFVSSSLSSSVSYNITLLTIALSTFYFDGVVSLLVQFSSSGTAVNFCDFKSIISAEINKF